MVDREGFEEQLAAIDKALNPDPNDAWLETGDASRAVFREGEMPPVPGFLQVRINIGGESVAVDPNIKSDPFAGIRDRLNERAAEQDARERAYRDRQRAHFAKYGIQDKLPIVLAEAPVVTEPEVEKSPQTSQDRTYSAEELAAMRQAELEYWAETSQHQYTEQPGMHPDNPIEDYAALRGYQIG